MVTGNI